MASVWILIIHMKQQLVNPEYLSLAYINRPAATDILVMCLQTNGGLDRPQLYINLVPAEINRLLIVRYRQPAS